MNWYLNVLKKYAVFSGRSQVAEYWYFVLFSVIISMILTLLDAQLGLYFPQTTIGILGLIYSLLVLIPSIAVGTRRLHDVGKSGWFQLIILIPIIGAVVLIVWLATSGKEEENKYGVSPKAK